MLLAETNWEAIVGGAAAAIAFVALSFSAWQWWSFRRTETTRLLLGERETIAFVASRIADSNAKVSKDVLDALVLAALFEPSNRARIQVYRALDSLKDGDKTTVVQLRMKYLHAADDYRSGLNLRRFCRRLTQLDKALPWIAADPRGEGAALKRELCAVAKR